MSEPLVVVVTGSECTGKTTLARELAEHYGTIWVPESARTYVERVKRPLTADDVEPIARGHLAAREEALCGISERPRRQETNAGPGPGSNMAPPRANADSPSSLPRPGDPAPLILLDTDLISTVLYARHYYGECPAWIEETARTNRGDLYLFLHPDVPWVADGLARDRGHMREAMHELFRERLTALGAPTVDISGGWDVRRERAVKALDALIVGRQILHFPVEWRPARQ